MFFAELFFHARRSFFFAAAALTMGLDLLDFPDEILLHTCLQLHEDKISLCNLSSTCRRFHALINTSPILWEDLFHDDDEEDKKAANCNILRWLGQERLKITRRTAPGYKNQLVARNANLSEMYKINAAVPLARYALMHLSPLQRSAASNVLWDDIIGCAIDLGLARLIAVITTYHQWEIHHQLIWDYVEKFMMPATESTVLHSHMMILMSLLSSHRADHCETVVSFRTDLEIGYNWRFDSFNLSVDQWKYMQNLLMLEKNDFSDILALPAVVSSNLKLPLIINYLILVFVDST